MSNRERLLSGVAWLCVVVGLAASVTSEVVHVRAYLDPEVASFCTVGSRFDCTTISLSRFAVFLGVPLPIWGIAGFLAMGVALWRQSRLFLHLAVVATVASFALLYVELRVVHKICLVCEAVHFASWLGFAVAVYLHDGFRQVSRRVATEALVPGALLVAATWTVLPEYWQIVPWDEPLPYAHGFDQSGHAWVGAEKPEVTIDEYLHYGCPHCSVAVARTRRWLESRGGRVRFVRHQMPLSRCFAGSEHCQLLRLALCAKDQGKFWEADGWLFSKAAGYKSIRVDKFAKALDLDADALTRCVDSKQTYARADEEAEQGFIEKRSEVPGFYVGDKHLKLSEVEKLLEGL